MTDPLRLSHFIANRWELERATDWTPTTNPSRSDDVIAQAPSATVADVDAAVTAARDALPGWRALTGMARAEHLYRWAGAIEARHEELAQAMAREVGKPIGEARGEVARCWVILRYYAGEAVREIGSVIPAQFPGVMQFTVRQPHGVVALITPWNFPLAIPLWKAAPALAFGNTVVLKPSELSPHMAQLLAETALAAELPPVSSTSCSARDRPPVNPFSGTRGCGRSASPGRWPPGPGWPRSHRSETSPIRRRWGGRTWPSS